MLSGFIVKALLTSSTGSSIVLGSGVSKIFVWMACSVFCGCFSEVLLRREQLPFASQSVRLKLVQHGTDMSQTQCD